MPKSIVIIDYSAGNLRSVGNAVAHLGYRAQVSNLPAELLAADVVILPGVGAAGDTMDNLAQRGLIEPIRQVIRQGKPFLGVCIGLQVLFTGTDEGGGQDCLDIIAGRVRRLPEGLKVPHMGWNQVKQSIEHPVFQGIPDRSNFYFVHSYYGQPDDTSVIAGVTEYGVEFPSVLIRGNLIATQFHPEKSGETGLHFYSNFLALAMAG